MMTLTPEALTSPLHHLSNHCTTKAPPTHPCHPSGSTNATSCGRDYLRCGTICCQRSYLKGDIGCPLKAHGGVATNSWANRCPSAHTSVGCPTTDESAQSTPSELKDPSGMVDGDQSAHQIFPTGKGCHNRHMGIYQLFRTSTKGISMPIPLCTLGC